MASRGDPYKTLELTQITHNHPPEIILETQFNSIHRNNRHIYKDILVMIGLDSPTTSQETMSTYDNDDHNQDQGMQVANTPIRNSATSLIALGKHVLTPG